MTDVARKPSLSDPSLYINRELSWLGFNNRVLEQARDERHPLLERVRFIAISETNLDEFFMIRVAGLQQQVASDLPNPVPDGMTPEEQLSRIHDHTEEFFEERRRILNQELIPALEDEGIRTVPHGKVRAAERRELRERFVRDILPILTPLAIDPAHPFPHISNLSLNLLVVIEDEGRKVRLDMTLTTVACPLTDMIEGATNAALVGLDDIQEVEINWVWSPPWGPDRLTEDGKMALRAMGFAI